MKVKVYFRTNTDGTRETAYLQYTENKKRSRVCSGVSIPAKPTTPIEKEERKEGLRMIDALRAKTEMQIAEGKSGIKTRFGKRKDFVKFVEDFCESENNISEGTKSVRRTFISHLHKCFVNGIDCKNVNENAVSEFIAHLQKIGNGKQSIHNMLIQFRLFVSIGSKKGYINPFEVQRVKPENKKREFLTNDELAKIEEHYNNSNNQVKECFRLFLFCCYTGLRISDAMSLNYNHIAKSANGSMMIRKEQKKTHNEVLIPLNEKAKNLIDVSKVGMKLNVFEHRETNSFNDMIQRHSPISKHLSSHIARHTFAVQLLERGADIYSVSRLLGHTSIRTTEIYADMTTTKANAIVSLLDK